MAKLYFHYSTMNAGKSTLLLQAAHNYHEGGMATYLLTARLDDRAGTGRIGPARVGAQSTGQVKTVLHEHRLEEGLLGGKVVVDPAQSQRRLVRHLTHGRGSKALLAEQRSG